MKRILIILGLLMVLIGTLAGCTQPGETQIFRAKILNISYDQDGNYGYKGYMFDFDRVVIPSTYKGISNDGKSILIFIYDDTRDLTTLKNTTSVVKITIQWHGGWELIDWEVMK